MLWAILAVAAAFVWSIGNVLDKFAVTKLARNPAVPLMFLGVISLFASLLIYAFKGFSGLSPFHILLAIAVGMALIPAILLYFKALQIDEVSRIIPILYVSPLFILIMAAFFLGEVFTYEKYLGIFLLVAGAVLVSVKNLKKFRFGEGFKLILASTLIGSVMSVITKYLLNFADFWTILSYGRIGMFLAVIPFFFINFKDLAYTLKKHGAKAAAVISAGDSLGMFGGFLMAAAFQLGFVTLATAVGSVQPFFVLLFTVALSRLCPKIIKEEVDKRTVFMKLIAILLMFIGVILII